jgi:hypothetical protein
MSTAVKTCTKCATSKDYGLFHKDATRKDGYRNICKACVAAYMQTHHVKNQVHIVAKAVKWVAENRAKHNAKCNQWAKQNAAKVNARTARRYASRTQATPKWLSSDDCWMIEQAYELATLRTKMFGFPWEVDHIVPLRGKTASGLHTPWNLQVVTQAENRRKSNSFEVAA